MTVVAGQPLPNPTLHGPDGPARLHDFLADGPLLVLFYQEDATPTCTTQLCAFRDDFELLDELGASVVAISADDPASHERFRDAQQLPYPLLSDPDLSAATAFGVADPATRRSRRAAFVAQPDGRIALAIPFYQPANLDHFEAVFTALGLDLSAL